MVNLNELDIVSNNESFNVSKKDNPGIMLSSSVDKSLYYHNELSENLNSINNVGISISNINNMNIILNDSDCSDTFFGSVCDYLKNYGIKFTTTKNCENINVNDAVIITLDQQYSSGAGTLVFAPYSNTQLGNSDALSIAMSSAFRENNISIDGILCGQMGFEDDGEGNVRCVVATDAEKAIDESTDCSFVTISLGTQAFDAKKIANSIKGGLARLSYYLENYDKNTDLIYKANLDDSVEQVANYFGADPASLISYNKIKNNSFSNSQTVINPFVQTFDVFDSNSNFILEDVTKKNIK